MDKLKDLDEKITSAINKVKALKAENTTLRTKMAELQQAVSDKDLQLEGLSSEKSDVRGQIEALLEELETIEIE